IDAAEARRARFRLGDAAAARSRHCDAFGLGLLHGPSIIACMAETNAMPDADQPFFQALLMPHRSLGRTGFLVVMSILGFASLVTGGFFLMHGAWPIFGFFGLDLLLIYIAFRLNYRAARAREEVSLSRTSLDILKTAPS